TFLGNLDLEGVLDVDHHFQRRQRVESEILAVVRGFVDFRRGDAGDAVHALADRVTDAFYVAHIFSRIVGESGRIFAQVLRKYYGGFSDRPLSALFPAAIANSYASVTEKSVKVVRQTSVVTPVIRFAT